MIICRIALPLLALTTLLSSCGKPAIESYRVPKETAAAAPAAAPGPTAAQAPMAMPAAPGTSGAAGGGSMAGTPVATAAGQALAWTAPPHWKQKPASAMRKGSYTVTSEGVPGEADLSISAFPGTVGGDLANLNRWRGQVQLPPVSQAEFEAGRQRLEHNGLQMTVVDLAGSGAGAQRILGAIIPLGDATWFVKMGPSPEPLVAKEKPAFLAFLATVKPAPTPSAK